MPEAAEGEPRQECGRHDIVLIQIALDESSLCSSTPPIGIVGPQDKFGKAYIWIFKAGMFKIQPAGDRVIDNEKVERVVITIGKNQGDSKHRKRCLYKRDRLGKEWDVKPRTTAR